VELKHLVDTIAVGNSSATVMAAINEREARLREITNQVIEPGPESLQEKLEELRTFAVLRLTRLRELLTNPAAIHEARALLGDQIGKFKLERVNENGWISFKANGNIDFFGEEVLTRVGGAGGGKWTERLPVHFEWLAEACEHSEKVARKALQLLLTFRRGSHRPLHKSSMIRLPL
jgi:hypothetical protein